MAHLGSDRVWVQCMWQGVARSVQRDVIEWWEVVGVCQLRRKGFLSHDLPRVWQSATECVRARWM
jgi:hypothetical protein